MSESLKRQLLEIVPAPASHLKPPEHATKQRVSLPVRDAYSDTGHLGWPLPFPSEGGAASLMLEAFMSSQQLQARKQLALGRDTTVPFWPDTGLEEE